MGWPSPIQRVDRPWLIWLEGVQDAGSRLQICPLNIFGNTPPRKMVPMDLTLVSTRVWRLDESGQIYNPEGFVFLVGTRVVVMFPFHQLAAQSRRSREATREELLLKHSAEMLVHKSWNEGSWILKAQMNKKGL